MKYLTQTEGLRMDFRTWRQGQIFELGFEDSGRGAGWVVNGRNVVTGRDNTACKDSMFRDQRKLRRARTERSAMLERRGPHLWAY